MTIPTFFIGVPPAPELSARIFRWQHTLEHVITVPHITLKAPGQLSAAQVAACRSVCQRTPPFVVSLGGVQTFGERVIFLDVQTTGAGLHALHSGLVKAVDDLNDQPDSVDRTAGFELERYHPHLTLALSWRPIQFKHVQDWAGVLASARAAFADLEALPLQVEMQEGVLFRKDRPGEPYQEAERWPLEG
jgi:2'-5' RNA ligase